MRAFLTVLGLVAFASSAHAAATCPLGPNDDHLTIQRVMINFGKFTATSDAVVREASSASQTEIDQAVADLFVVQACADAVVTGTSDDLLPASAKKLTGVARTQLEQDFKSVMQNFSIAIADSIAALTAHDFTSASAARKRANDIADDAHSRF